MKKVYLDNAATTPLLPEVISSFVSSLETTYGNPSSTHSFGRSSRALIENARKSIAKQLHCTTSELVFTSGGTEADNLILKNAVYHLNVTHIISSKLEHHAVLHTIDFLASKNTTISYVKTLPDGTLDYDDLEKLLQNSTTEKTLISLLHVNNEIGTILDLDKVIALKQKYKALFHTDTVQSIGHFDINLVDLDIDFLAASAHKFHGPKGIGFAFFRKGTGIQPEILGGEQERGSRAGTENTPAIVGMEKALTVCLSNLEKDLHYLKELKHYFMSELKNKIPSVKFNGVSGDLNKSTHTVLSVQFSKDLPMLLFQLDLKGIAVSGGSACQSGANKGSHVLQSFLNDEEQQNTSVRFSFSKLNTQDEIDYVIAQLLNVV
ncbi:cysteine desulfurase family protein [Wenyingzhuangia sp. 2_MG-2023]|uniref:cysteine desulfurase family protein n=1 Tax=Wenyingzhuangia sp. 2_MG-2023 TaxID=3062639 RepID=UPI0026E1673E|nr:cysteine desulfurase family protein [Wenyingzhuangia sp. 2_MG-2023]MDO6738914.1 cysteine desulfurase family protein [Wenyingzhuangia sp. 2_MG-2023]